MFTVTGFWRREDAERQLDSIKGGIVAELRHNGVVVGYVPLPAEWAKEKKAS